MTGLALFGHLWVLIAAAVLVYAVLSIVLGSHIGRRLDESRRRDTRRTDHEDDR